MIIQNLRIACASAILPLAETAPLSINLGTRHRAALGISQVTDAVVIVVSEESGTVSVARDGVIIRGVKVDRFLGILRTVFLPLEKQHKGTSSAMPAEDFS